MSALTIRPLRGAKWREGTKQYNTNNFPQKDNHAICGPGNSISLSVSIEPAAIFTLCEKVWFAVFVLRILVIMDDEICLIMSLQSFQKPDDETLHPQGDNFTLEDGILTGPSQDQSTLQETCLSLNGFLPNSTKQQAGRKRSYPASQLSVQAPSCLSVRDKEPLSKVAKVSDVSTGPFASALLAAKEEVQTHFKK